MPAWCVIAGKEYTRADSRYATRDSFVISVEALTAFVVGPACFLAVWAILHRRPWAPTLKILISCGQIYGDILYFGTTFLEGKSVVVQVHDVHHSAVPLLIHS